MTNGYSISNNPTGGNEKWRTGFKPAHCRLPNNAKWALEYAYAKLNEIERLLKQLEDGNNTKLTVIQIVSQSRIAASNGRECIVQVHPRAPIEAERHQ